MFAGFSVHTAGFSFKHLTQPAHIRPDGQTASVQSFSVWWKSSTNCGFNPPWCNSTDWPVFIIATCRQTLWILWLVCCLSSMHNINERSVLTADDGSECVHVLSGSDSRTVLSLTSRGCVIAAGVQGKTEIREAFAAVKERKTDKTMWAVMWTCRRNEQKRHLAQF